jgi:hypothetical protein
LRSEGIEVKGGRVARSALRIERLPGD